MGAKTGSPGRPCKPVQPAGDWEGGDWKIAPRKMFDAILFRLRLKFLMTLQGGGEQGGGEALGGRTEEASCAD